MRTNVDHLAETAAPVTDDDGNVVAYKFEVVTHRGYGGAPKGGVVELADLVEARQLCEAGLVKPVTWQPTPKPAPSGGPAKKAPAKKRPAKKAPSRKDPE